MSLKLYTLFEWILLNLNELQMSLMSREEHEEHLNYVLTWSELVKSFKMNSKRVWLVLTNAKSSKLNLSIVEITYSKLLVAPGRCFEIKLKIIF